jgi:hypothetical protein
VVECLPSKHEALGSKPSTSTKKERKKERKQTAVYNYHTHRKRFIVRCYEEV